MNKKDFGCAGDVFFCDKAKKAPKTCNVLALLTNGNQPMAMDRETIAMGATFMHGVLGSGIITSVDGVTSLLISQATRSAGTTGTWSTAHPRHHTHTHTHRHTIDHTLLYTDITHTQHWCSPRDEQRAL
ncbi:unnamed protein product [Danaus chrysippus]|uniref:(African queen) hypothetical protein n=1 Tax=Danaus chrysippus TaxID=151541 RepID=A0A8J2VXZ5_9NEOP|nr:unnamed protein product [Danaus chrysippus]